MAIKVVFFGNERLATGVTTDAPTLQMLVDEGYDVCAVVSNYEQARSRKSRELEIATVAKLHNIPVLLPNKPTEIINQLKEYGADVAVLVAYGRIIPQSIIDIFPAGIVNIHPSLLPAHRGPTPIESVILGGDRKTGVSVMKLVSKMDAGPVYGYTEFELHGNESKQDLANTLLDMGASMIRELLPGIVEGSIAAQPQDEPLATYDALIQKNAGNMDFTKPADQLEREVRAYAVWPKSTTQLAGIDVIITSASVVDIRGDSGVITVDNKRLLIGCADVSLEIKSLKPAGKSDMTAAAFIAGYGSKL